MFGTPSAQGSPLRGNVKKFAIGSVLVVLFSTIAVATALLNELHADFNAFIVPAKTIKGLAPILADVEPGEPQTILLLGSDRRLADIKAKLKPRSDTIIVAHLDPDKHATAIMSLPRDLLVDIPGHGRAKLNDAFHIGGSKLMYLTVTDLLNIDIHHVINVNFNGFQRAVNKLGCVYVDVDRRYFNDNTGPGENYAVIDLKPGYQKLCGSDALDYVRFRHQDSDFVRAARQQEFLRQSKAQIGLDRLFSDRRELLTIFGNYTETDIADDNDAEILGLLKLAYEASKEPLTEVRFPATDCPDRSCVEIAPDDLIDTVDRFIDVRGAGDEQDKGATPRRVKPHKGLAPGLVFAQQEGENVVLAMDLRLSALGLPVYLPRARLAKGGYSRDGSPRSYEIFDRHRKRHRAYRIVLSAGESGEYYGVQGTTWKDPPILEHFDDEVRMRGRTYQRYFDGRRLRMIAWKRPEGVYWVSNTLSRTLTNAQMMDIARSLQRISG